MDFLSESLSEYQSIQSRFVRFTELCGYIRLLCLYVHLYLTVTVNDCAASVAYESYSHYHWQHS